MLDFLKWLCILMNQTYRKEIIIIIFGIIRMTEVTPFLLTENSLAHTCELLCWLDCRVHCWVIHKLVEQIKITSPMHIYALFEQLKNKRVVVWMLSFTCIPQMYLLWFYFHVSQFHCVQMACYNKYREKNYLLWWKSRHLKILFPDS